MTIEKSWLLENRTNIFRNYISSLHLIVRHRLTITPPLSESRHERPRSDAQLVAHARTHVRITYVYRNSTQGKAPSAEPVVSSCNSESGSSLARADKCVKGRNGRRVGEKGEQRSMTRRDETKWNESFTCPIRQSYTSGAKRIPKSRHPPVRLPLRCEVSPFLSVHDVAAHSFLRIALRSSAKPSVSRVPPRSEKSDSARSFRTRHWKKWGLLIMRDAALVLRGKKKRDSWELKITSLHFCSTIQGIHSTKIWRTWNSRAFFFFFTGKNQEILIGILLGFGRKNSF